MQGPGVGSDKYFKGSGATPQFIGVGENCPDEPPTMQNRCADAGTVARAASESEESTNTVQLSAPIPALPVRLNALFAVGFSTKKQG